MANVINLKTFLWALGTIQPATADEAYHFMKMILKVNGDIYTAEDLEHAIQLASELGYIDVVSKKNALYILTIEGGEFLGKKLRLLRDKNRLLLLKSIRYAINKAKDSPERNLDGVSPSNRFRSTLKVAPWPENSLPTGPQPHSQRVFWPRVSEQLRIGSNSGESLSSIRLNFYSRNGIPSEDNSSALSGINILSELVGVSPRLISSFIKGGENHYRSFSIMKKSNRGRRVINSPKAFIKTFQYWILDYFLFKLKVHDSCFSFRAGLSIKNNAAHHLNSKYLLCLDIESFFDNISRRKVANCLIENGIDRRIVSTISGIVTLNDALPQGAPTSPLISNAYLFKFDEIVSAFCRANNITYSRYADDLTFGSSQYEILVEIIGFISQQLHQFGLTLNDRKTRIISEHNSQVITGVSINNGVLRPCRKLRKKIRAIFYQARINKNIDALPSLFGYINYLSNFDCGDTEYNLTLYKTIISELKTIEKIEA